MAIPVGPTSFTVLAIRPACEMTRFPVQYRSNTFFTDGACLGSALASDPCSPSVRRVVVQEDGCINHGRRVNKLYKDG